MRSEPVTESAEPEPRARGGTWAWMALPFLLFAVGLAAAMTGFARYHGDERFYTNAAIRMIETGDYWTPYFADGRIRLLKPILNYWAVAGSFQALGVNLFASRVPGLLSGLAIVCATAWLAWIVFKSRTAALLAGLVIISNVELMTLSGRATPDTVVCLWVLVSLCGFARIWFGSDRDSGLAGPLIGWAGLGLAVQTKGLLGVFPLVVCVLYALLARPPLRAERFRRMFDWRAVALGVAVAGFWYIEMLRLHGAGALRAFFDDQVGAKVHSNPLAILANLVKYFFTGVQQFSLWLVVLTGALFAAKKASEDQPSPSVGAGREIWNLYRREIVFLGILFPLLVLSFSFGNMRTSRYVMLSYPELAALVAGGLSGLLENRRFQQSFRRALRVAAIGLVFVGGLLLFMGLQASPRMAVGGALSLCGAGFIFWTTLRPDPVAPAAATATLLVLGFVVFEGTVRPVTRPTPIANLAQALALQTAKPVLAWKVDEVLLSQIVLASGGRLKFEPVRSLASAPGRRETLLTTAKLAEEAKAAGFNIQPLPHPEPPAELQAFLERVQRRKQNNSPWRDTRYVVGTRARTED